MTQWSALWKASAKRHRANFKEVLADYHDLLFETCELDHAEKLERWLKEFRRRIARKKWRTAQMWRVWYRLKYREQRLEHLKRLQAPQVIINKEVELIEKGRKGFNLALFLERMRQDLLKPGGR